MQKFFVMDGNTKIEFRTLEEAEEYATLYGFAAPVQFEEEIPSLSIAEIAEKRIMKGEEIAFRATVMISAINDSLGFTAEQSNTAISSFFDLEQLIRKGGLKSARTIVEGMIASYPFYADALNYVINEINKFELEYGL